MPGRALLLLAVWKNLYTEIHGRGAKNVSVAARRFMQTTSRGVGRRIILMGHDGTVLDTILDEKRLRKWWYEFETLLRQVASDDPLARQAESVRANFAKPETQRVWAHWRANIAEIRELKRAQLYGGRTITSEDLERIFPIT
ncbi:MAG: hypothetical protein EOO27_19505 [Comamonadaceae bacterium]|nr:MAG: hypothetical protein EOO27_19505 [Comamonadaceae bacterium]